MAESSLKKSHLQDPNPNPTSSYSSFSVPSKSKTLAKSLIIIFVLIVFSYFSSQVPDFFNKNPILTNLWDLIYLLVIGIVVCYGLFTKKIDNNNNINNNNNNNNIDEIETYLSGISQISSIFEDNPYRFDENTTTTMPNPAGGTGMWDVDSHTSTNNSYGFDENGFGKSDGKKLSQYFLGESLVVISDEKYVLEQLGKPKIIKQNQPLGLPVRNLAARKSVINDSSSGLVPIKLEDKFKETTDIDSPTAINWRSKSTRLANETSHFGFDFDNLKSQSMRYSMSSQMKNYSEIEESKVLETNHDINGETSFLESKPREFCIGSSSEKNNRSSCKEILEDIGKNKVDNVILDSNRNVQFIKSKSQRSSNSLSSHKNNRSSFKDFGTTKVDDCTLGSNSNATFIKSKSQRSSAEALDYVLGKEDKSDSSNSILKPASITNTYKRGKSVRTNRLKEQVLEANGKTFPSQTDDKVDTITKFETTGMNVKADYLSDTELHSGEVDRKADEFIAKFREQIRLQKVASATNLRNISRPR